MPVRFGTVRRVPVQRRSRTSAHRRRPNFEVALGQADIIVIGLDEDDIAALGDCAGEVVALEVDDDGNLVEVNPSRNQWIAGAIGMGLLGGAIAWWLLRDKPAVTPVGHVQCPNIPYPAVVRIGDYVVVQLAANNGSISEPTWAKVLSRSGNKKINVEIVGETGQDGPKPIATDRHGFSIGQKLTIDTSCIYDRFRPGQAWRVLCGPALASAGFEALPGNQASILGMGDRALVVVGGNRGGIEPLWLEVSGVSVGQQTIRGVVVTAPVLTDHGLRAGDEIEFLRDCVTDAEFGG